MAGQRQGGGGGMRAGAGAVVGMVRQTKVASIKTGKNLSRPNVAARGVAQASKTVGKNVKKSPAAKDLAKLKKRVGTSQAAKDLQKLKTNVRNSPAARDLKNAPENLKTLKTNVRNSRAAQDLAKAKVTGKRVAKKAAKIAGGAYIGREMYRELDRLDKAEQAAKLKRKKTGR